MNTKCAELDLSSDGIPLGQANLLLDSEGKIHAIRFNFDPWQWVGLLSKQGNYLPACCGTISSIRDLFFESMREDGYMDLSDFLALVEHCRNHKDSFEGLFKIKGKVTRQAPDPFLVVNHVFQYLTKNKDRISDCDLPNRPSKKPLDASISWVNKLNRFMVMEWCYRNSSTPEELKQTHDLGVYLKAKLYPGVVKLKAALEKDLGTRSYKFFAICYAGRNKIASTSKGPCFFRTHEDAALFLKSLVQNQIPTEIRRVRISREGGIKFGRIKRSSV